nr:Protein Y38H6A.5, isoform b [Haemonchus contortus]
MYLRIFSFLSLPLFCWAVQCYSGSQLQVIECPALSCIKQTLGFDTVRYCDGTGVSSICQTYRIFETCRNSTRCTDNADVVKKQDRVPNLIRLQN